MNRANLAGLVAGLIFLISCQNNGHKNARAPQAVNYPVVSIPQKTVTTYTLYPASIEGTINSAVRAKVSGYITDVLVDEGRKVHKGQALFTIETQTLSQDADAAKAAIDAAKVEVEKLEPLVEKNIVGKVQLSSARAKLAQSIAHYNSIVAHIDYATVKSPVDGYVGAIPHRQGTLVGPSDPVPLTTVSATDEVYAYFAMNEVDYLNFMQNTEGAGLNEKIQHFPPVELQLANGNIYAHQGRIETVTGQVNTTTGTVSFRATFPNPERLLANGSSGKIRIPETYENAVVVPETATFEQQGRVYVYKLQNDTLAVSASIEIKDRVDNLAVVASGVNTGDFIIAQGVGKIQNQSVVNTYIVPFDSIVGSIQAVFK